MCILIWSFLLISIQSLPLAANGTRVEEKCQPTSQSFLDSSPFFRMAPSRFQSQQILFLTEFSRFMNRHAPTMMKVSTTLLQHILHIILSPIMHEERTANACRRQWSKKTDIYDVSILGVCWKKANLSGGTNTTKTQTLQSGDGA